MVLLKHARQHHSWEHDACGYMSQTLLSTCIVWYLFIADMAASHSTTDMCVRKSVRLQFVKSPDYSSIPNFVGAEFSDPKYWEPSAENTKKLHAAAAAFNEIWKTGDASIADKILDKDVIDYNLMFGGEPKTGAEQFKKMITGVFKVRTAAVKSLHPNICTDVHCSIPLHPELPWFHESAHHWGSRDQV